MDVVEAPNHLFGASAMPWMFLAGTIDMGNSFNWQKYVINLLEDQHGTIYNPRRGDWDVTWRQSIDDPKFKEQVTWELDYLEKSDVVLFHFEPDSQSPVTLLELGILARDKMHKDVIVHCPERFWRKGNVDIVCERYNIPQIDELEDIVDFLKENF